MQATDISEAEKRKREELQATFHSFKRQRVEEPAVETSNTPKPAPPSFTTAPPTKVVFTAQLPKGWLAATDSSNNKTYYYHEASRTTRWSIPSAAEAGSVEDQWRREKDKREAQRRPKTLEEIMSSIAASEMERKKKQEEESTTVQAATDAMKTKADGPVAKPLSLHKASKKSKHSRHKQASKSSNKSREHEALKLFTPVVIGVLSKYARKHLDRDQFKKRAKELSHLLVDKEKKSSKWETEDYSKMTPEKEKKMRSFCKDWVAKLVVRCKASKSSKSASSPSKSTTSTPAPTTESSHEDRDDSSIDKEMADLMAEVNGEQQEEDMENDDDDGDEGASPQPSASDSTPAFDTQQFHEQSQSGSRSPSTAPPPPPPVSAVQVVGESTLGDANAEATMTLEEADLAVEATNHNDTSLLVVEEQNGHGINGQSHIIPAVPAPPPPPDI